MKLYFVRHGQTNANVGMSSGGTISETDEPLNDEGIKQAQVLAAQLKDVVFDAIISSPLARARQTADIVNQYHHLDVTFDKVWCERKADTYIDANKWADLFDFDKNLQVENSESLSDFFDRVYAAIDALRHEYADKTVLVVSHGGVQHALYAYANKLPRVGNMRISPMKNCEFRVYEL